MATKKFVLDFIRRCIAACLVYSFIFLSFSMLAAKAHERKLFDEFARPDAVTFAVRDKSKILQRVTLQSESERRELEKAGKIVEDYGSFVLVATGAKSELKGFNKQRVETTINLPGRKFDPVQTPPTETLRPNAEIENPSEKDYYIVQFAGHAKDEWLESLREVGAEILQYVPHQAFFVYADGEAIAKITGHSRVRWVGRFTAEDKISTQMRQELSLRQEADGTASFDISVFNRAKLEDVSQKISVTTRGKIISVSKLPNNFFNVIRVEVPVSEVAELAKINDVVRIDPYIRPTREDEKSSQIVAGNYTNNFTLSGSGYNPFTQFGVNGQGVTVSVVDDGVGIPGEGGFYINPGKAVDGNLRGANAGADGHGHLNATIIAGDVPFATPDSAGFNYGLGIAPKANIINIPFLRANPNYTGTNVDTINDALTTVAPNGTTAFISNNSWGAGGGGNSYDSLAAQYDGLVQDGTTDATIAPSVIIFSAGNSGTGGMTRPKAAKNIIAVANSENLRPELSLIANNIDDLDISSSRGPATDGRIKPDISAPGTAITGGRAGNDLLFGNIDNFHRWSSGTSHAAPQIAGAAALFTQFWKNQNFGQNPSPALVKAAIINTAQEMNGAGSEAKIPNGSEGWGRINLKYMFNTGVPVRYINQTTTFSNPGEGMFISGKVVDSTKPVRISLVWTDPPGVSDPALVNNLDLTVTIGGVIYKGNVFANGISASGGLADTKNNVENVFLPAGIPAGTNFTIQVSATALNGNGILGNSDSTDQNFGLVAYNFQESASTANKNSDFDGDGKSDIAVFRPSNGTWYLTNSSNSAFVGNQFGANGDVITPGDYDGDGRTDYAVFRPSVGGWYIMRSLFGFTATQFGMNGDIPTQGDFDGDGKTDISVFRPSTGAWYRLNSANGQFVGTQFGAFGDKPVQADFDGDGKTDIAVWRESSGSWYRLNSSNGQFVGEQFGAPGDKPVQGDYDGDSRADYAVFRPSNGTWYLQRSLLGFTGFQFGGNGDIPSPADYDGDGRTDYAVFRNGTWYLQRSVQGFSAFGFGAAGDRPISNGYLPQ